MADHASPHRQPTEIKLEASTVERWAVTTCAVALGLIIIPNVRWHFSAGAVAIVTAFGLLALIFGRALLSSVVVGAQGLRIHNFGRPERTASWDEVQEVLIAPRSLRCRITFLDGSQVWARATVWPTNWDGLVDLRKWLDRYGSPLRLRIESGLQVRYRHDRRS